MRCRVALAIVLASSAAAADSMVSVTLNQRGQDLADQIGLSLPGLIADAQGRIQELFELQGLPRLLRSFADTGVFANHSLGVDYQAHPGDLMFGLVAGSAIASDARLSSDRVLSATVINYGFVASANLARWNQPRWSVYLNGSYAATTIRGFSGELVSAAGHAQYKLLVPVTRGAIMWTGLDVTSGLEYARWEVGLSSTLDTNITVTGTNDHATVGMLSSGTLTVYDETFAVPFELSTGVRLASVLGLYVGGGLTFAGGSSTITAMLDSRLTINADDLHIGDARIVASESVDPTSVLVHALAGAQIHTRHVRIYLQGGITPDERSVALGLRVGFQ